MRRELIVKPRPPFQSPSFALLVPCDCEALDPMPLPPFLSPEFKLDAFHCFISIFGGDEIDIVDFVVNRRQSDAFRRRLDRLPLRS
jgi:hypothetical protein